MGSVSRFSVRAGIRILGHGQGVLVRTVLITVKMPDLFQSAIFYSPETAPIFIRIDRAPLPGLTIVGGFEGGACAAAHFLWSEYMPEQQTMLDENFLARRADVGLDLGQRRIEHIKAVLNERMAALGALDLFELVAMEAVHYAMPLPQTVAWDPAIVNAGITLPEPYLDADDDGVRPLRLKWIEKTQKWGGGDLAGGARRAYGPVWLLRHYR
jgi:hypothetical protein